MQPKIASTARLRFSIKKEFQGKYSSRIATPNKPKTAPPPAIPTQTLTALPRDSGGKDVVITESVEGMMKAAPTPIRILAAIR